MPRPRRRRRWYADTRGLPGIGAGIGAAIGVFVWWPIAVASAAGWLALAGFEAWRSVSAVEHLERELGIKPVIEGTSQHVGAIRGLRIEVDDNVDDITVRVGFPPACAPLALGSGRRGLTGDPAFDDCFQVVTDNVAWRLALGPAIRARLVVAYAGISLAIQDRVAQFVIRDEEADGPELEALIRGMVDLGHDMAAAIAVEQPEHALLASLPREPAPGVRIRHYQWLLSRNFEVPAVLLQAAADPDPQISAWARAQRPQQEIYR